MITGRANRFMIRIAAAAACAVVLNLQSDVAADVLIETDVAAVDVPENGTATFAVRLTVEPAEDVTVTVQRTAGDPDISVQFGSALVFTPSNWEEWQTVTLAAAIDDDWINGIATITCSAPGLPDVEVEATEIDWDHPPATLPFIENFESDTVSVGDIRGQNEWSANRDGAAFVQTDLVYEGAQALRLSSAAGDHEVWHGLSSTAQTVWIDFMFNLQNVTDLSTPPPIPADSAVGFLFNGEGRLMVWDGLQAEGEEWVTLTNHTPRALGEWVRLSVLLDYQAQTWRIALDGTLLSPEDLGFAYYSPGLDEFRASGHSDALDRIYVSETPPPLISMDGDLLPDEWEMYYFGHLNYGDDDDSDEDGMTNWEEYLAGTNPNDAQSYLGFTAVDPSDVVSGEIVLRWQSVADRNYAIRVSTNLWSGFDQIVETEIPATPPVNVYTDAVTGVTHRFYLIELE